MPSKEWRAANPMRSAYIVLKSNAKQAAKRKGIPFHQYWGLSFEEFKAHAIKTKLLTSRGRHIESNTVDRKNPLAGYFDWNIQTMKKADNSSKGATLHKAIHKSYVWIDNGDGTGCLKIKAHSNYEIEDSPF